MIRTLTGENSFVRQQALHKIVDEFVHEHGDMALERLDAEEVSGDRIRAALESMPFLASKKLVVILQPASNKDFVDMAETWLQNVADTTDVLLVEDKFDKRSKLYKYLKKATEFEEFTALDESAMARWLSEEAKARGGNLSVTDARVLLQRVGADQQLLNNELNKLLLYSETITKQSIELLTEPTPQSSVFDLLDAALNGRSKQALKLYHEQRALRVEPQQIIAMLAWQLHVLAIVSVSDNRDARTIAADAKMSPYAVQKSQTLARRLSKQKLVTLLARVRRLDARLKSESIDADEAMMQLLISME